MVAIREHFILIRQVGAAAIDQVDARQIVLLGYLLRPQMFFDAERIVGAALDGCIVAYHHALLPRDTADAGNHAGGGRCIAAILVLVDVIGGQLRKLHERRAGIKQHLHPLARQQLAARHMLFARSVATTLGDLRDLLTQIIHQQIKRAGIFLEFFAAWVQLAF